MSLPRFRMVRTSGVWLPLLLAGFFSLAAEAPAAAPDAPSAPAPQGDWKPLFNGKNFDGLYVLIHGKKRNEDSDKVYQVDEGAIHVFKDTPLGTKTPIGIIATTKEYSNYHLRFQYKWGVKRFPPREKVVRDAGLMYHVVGPDEVWPMSIECQVQQHDTGDIWTVHTRVATTVDPLTVTPNKLARYLPKAKGGVPDERGSAKGIARIIKDGMYEVDGWNTVEAIVHGDQATHIVNGHVVNRCWKMQRPGPAGGPAWVPLDKGHIAFQAEFSEVYYRNIEIRELPNDTAKTDPQDPSAR